MNRPSKLNGFPGRMPHESGHAYTMYIGGDCAYSDDDDNKLFFDLDFDTQHI